MKTRYSLFSARLGAVLLLAAGFEVAGAPQDPEHLTITRVGVTQGCATLEFVSPDPLGRHQLEESSDLRVWRPIPIARFEQGAGNELCTTLVGLAAETTFFRIVQVERPAVDPPAYVNLQIDAELDDHQGIRNMIDELVRRGLTATIFVTADYANRNAFYISQVVDRGFEIAMHGFYTGEQLASMTYEEQRDLLRRALLALEGCRPCGTYRPIAGFRPQYFSQNEDTFRVLNELGIVYNSGFKVGDLYLPGYQWEAMPYRPPGRGFHALPITTVPVDGKLVYLCDIACANVLQWTPAQWRDGLMQGLEQTLETRQPLVLLLHGYFSGDLQTHGYWQPFLDFLDAAQGQVTFVQSGQLVDLARPNAE